jgi:hypothetical protein
LKSFFHRGDGLEDRLRTRHEPRDEFLQDLVSRAEARRGTRTFRVALAGVLTLALLGAIAAVGGVGYASSPLKAIKAPVKAIQKAVSPSHASPRLAVRQLTSSATSSSSQYEGKTTICHRADSKHYVQITVANSALPAHAKHGDIIPAPPGGCPAHP